MVAEITNRQSAGITAIAVERDRQMSAEGFSLERDQQYTNDELARAAICYLQPQTTDTPPEGWPWDASWWKPSDNRLVELRKAGALVAAAYDQIDFRLQQEIDDVTADLQDFEVSAKDHALVDKQALLTVLRHVATGTADESLPEAMSILSAAFTDEEKKTGKVDGRG